MGKKKKIPFKHENSQNLIEESLQGLIPKTI